MDSDPSTHSLLARSSCGLQYVFADSLPRIKGVNWEYFLKISIVILQTQ